MVAVVEAQSISGCTPSFRDRLQHNKKVCGSLVVVGIYRLFVVSGFRSIAYVGPQHFGRRAMGGIFASRVPNDGLVSRRRPCVCGIGYFRPHIGSTPIVGSDLLVSSRPLSPPSALSIARQPGHPDDRVSKSERDPWALAASAICSTWFSLSLRSRLYSRIAKRSTGTRGF